jgi:hypothetical protein
MKDIILLGAGASVEAGLPDAIVMTKTLLEMSDTIDRTQPGKSELRTKLLRFVVGGLLFQNGINGNDPLKTGVNIESVFNAIDLLGQRNNVEFAPFVGSWHPVVEEISRLNRTNRYEEHQFRRNFDNAFASLSEERSSFFTAGELYNAIVGIVNSRVTSDNSVFKDTLDWMTQALIQIVRVSDYSQTKYLEPLLRLENYPKRVIATLNYDNALEIAAQNLGVNLLIGIESWTPGKYPRIDTGVQLLKLHGSINWEANHVPTYSDLPQQPVFSELPFNEIRGPDYTPGVLFGGSNKLTTTGPFLDMLSVFRDELSAAGQLTVIGYSFHDSHINDYIAQWLTDTTKVLRIINGPEFSASPDGFSQQLLLASKTSKFSGRIYDTGLFAGEGIRKYFGS